MRMILSFVVASAFFSAGLYVLFCQAFTARFLTIRGIGSFLHLLVVPGFGLISSGRCYGESR
jgi:hypothetical protein